MMRLELFVLSFAVNAILLEGANSYSLISGRMMHSDDISC